MEEQDWSREGLRKVAVISSTVELSTVWHLKTYLLQTLPAQRTGFNTLDNWGHKTPTQSKRKKTEKKRLKGHGPEHVYNTLGYILLLLWRREGKETEGHLWINHTLILHERCGPRSVSEKNFALYFVTNSALSRSSRSALDTEIATGSRFG